MGACCSSPDEQGDRLNKELVQDKQQDKEVKKLLLLGAGSSGKTTFFKQLKCIHGDGFSVKDKSDYRAQIESQIIEQMQKIIARAREMQEEFPGEYKQLSLQSPLAIDSAGFVESLRRDSSITSEVAKNIKILWKDPGILATFEMRARFAIPDSCDHFFNDIDRIAQEKYDPSMQDILLVRKRTTGIIEEYLTINETRFHIFDVGGQRNERKKWIHCFENVTAVVFVASLSSYDERLLEDENVIVMNETLNLFEEICNSRWFTKTSMILFLNKKDLFEEKLKHVKLQVCWEEYNGANDYSEAIEFIKLAFSAKNRHKDDKQLYIHVTMATDPDNVKRVFNDVQHAVINSQLKTGGLL